MCDTFSVKQYILFPDKDLYFVQHAEALMKYDSNRIINQKSNFSLLKHAFSLPLLQPILRDQYYEKANRTAGIHLAYNGQSRSVNCSPWVYNYKKKVDNQE